MLKKLSPLFSFLAMTLLLSACDKPKDKSGGLSSQPGDELIGYWQNTTTLSSRERRSGVVMRMHFFRENGALVVEWCSSNGTSGLSYYKVQGKRLMISGSVDKADAKNSDLNLDAEITSLKPDQLILNASNVYQRFTPTENLNRVCLR